VKNKTKKRKFICTESFFITGVCFNTTVNIFVEKNVIITKYRNKKKIIIIFEPSDCFKPSVSINKEEFDLTNFEKHTRPITDDELMIKDIIE